MNFKHIISAAFVALLVASCSNINENERLIYVEPATVNRNVLIEDFTGQKCVNCPNATESIKKIQEVYGEEHIVAVAIHCGRFGFAGNKKYVGLMNDTGSEYWSHWFEDSQGQPVAKINRGAATEEYSNWSSIVAEEMKKSTTVKIMVTASITKETRELKTHAFVEDLKEGKGKLQLWLVEDGIVAMQSMPDNTTNTEYVHNHVFRAALNGSWGEDISYSNGSASFDNTFIIPEGYNIDNCSIVAFVYSDNGVEQVEKGKIVDPLTQPVY